MRFRTLVWATCVALGCSSSAPDFPPGTDKCNPDAGYCSPLSMGGAGTTITTGTGGAAPTSDLMGTVHRITSASFADTGAAYAGPANIAVYPAEGSEINVSYGGAAGTTFDAKNVAAGKAWLFVQDQTMGASSVWSTVSSVSVPQITSVTLPVVDQSLVTTLASKLSSVQAKGVSSSAAHVVLLITHAGAPYQGVQVSGGAGGAIVVYDTGTGTYSDTATATGSAGTVILFDANLSGAATITLADPAKAKSWPVSVLTGTGAFTMASFDLE